MKFRAILFFILIVALNIEYAHGQSTSTATTTLTLSICGNTLVDVGEQCDVPGETGVYSQTITGRQCTPACLFGSYCGDGILQTIFAEECDDGNNDSGDFCSDMCKIEPAGSGGGGSTGGGSGGGGGSTKDLGGTVLSITGNGYPSQRINFLIDSKSVGNVQANSSGAFQFATNVKPGTATLGIWATDKNGTKSVTLNNTFDVTQGAITNLNGIVLPPTIKVASQNVTPGSTITVSGQSVPNATIELVVDASGPKFTTTAASTGLWSLQMSTAGLSVAEHTLRVRSITGTPPLTTQSNYSSTLQLFLGVEGQAGRPSDLNRDGFVNLIDFSILIFWWTTNGGDSDPPADINGNGKVSLEDFSILLFNWTG